MSDALKAAYDAVSRVAPVAIRAVANIVPTQWIDATKTMASPIIHQWRSIKSLGGAGADAMLRAISGVESSYGRNLFDRTGGTGLGMYQMSGPLRRTFGVSAAQAMDPAASTAIAKQIIFGKYAAEFHGDIAKAISAWHSGPGWVEKHGLDVSYLAKVAGQMRAVAPVLPPERKTPVLAGGRGSGAPISMHFETHIHVAPGAAGVDLNAIENHVHNVIRKAGTELHETLARENNRRARTRFY